MRLAVAFPARAPSFALNHSGHKTTAVAVLRPKSIDGVPSSSAAEQFISLPSVSPKGFEILIWSDETGIRVCLGGLEQEFDTVEGAKTWVARAMSEDCLLRVDFCGKRPYRWTLEYSNRDKSKRESLMFGHPVFPGLFKKKWSVYRQNRLSDYAPTVLQRVEELRVPSQITQTGQ